MDTAYSVRLHRMDGSGDEWLADEAGRRLEFHFKDSAYAAAWTAARRLVPRGVLPFVVELDLDAEEPNS